MVSLDALFALEDIRIDSSLCKECNAVELCSFFGEYLNEFLAYNVALLFRIGNALEKI